MTYGDVLDSLQMIILCGPVWPYLAETHANLPTCTIRATSMLSAVEAV
jgi:hypothetical protein